MKKRLLAVFLILALTAALLPTAAIHASAADGVVQITTQPKNASAQVGVSVSFSVKASGSSLSYQWQYSADSGASWANCTSSGSKTSTFSFTVAQRLDGRLFRCVVFNSNSSVVSNSAKLTIDHRPAITAQPKNVTTQVGASVSFSVTAAGDSPSYRWQYSADGGTSWTNCTSSGSKTSVFSFTAAERLDGRRFRCVVTNQYGSVTSNAATLTITNKPVITAQPKNASAKIGASASFSVTATGDGLSYQWQYSTNSGTSWTNCSSSGAKTSVFSFTAAERFNGRLFRCVVSNQYGSVNSNSAKLTIDYRPLITAQPQNVTVQDGKKAVFTVTASGVNLSYQWQFSTDNGASWADCNLSGADTDYFYFWVTQNLSGRRFRCVVSNQYGSTVSNAVKLTVDNRPMITQQPENVSAPAETSVSFYVGADGEDMKYQWQYSANNGSSWSNCSSAGYNTDTFSFRAAERLNGRLFRCVVSNSYGKTYSNAAKLKVTAALPVITQEPDYNPRFFNGQKATLTCKATGTGISYQWYRSVDYGSTWIKCASASSKTSSITFTAKPEYTDWIYYCEVKNESGSVQSDYAWLTVSKYAKPADGLGNSLMTYSEKCNLVFGKVVDWPTDYYASAAEAQKHMKTVSVKVWDINSSGAKVTKTKSFLVHENIAPTVTALFAEIYALPEKPPIHSVGGYRAGTGSSEHYVGLAIDVNPTENYYCDPDGNAITGSFFKPGVNPYSMPVDGSVQQIFEKYGFSRGIYWSSGYKDYMHYSFFGT